MPKVNHKEVSDWVIEEEMLQEDDGLGSINGFWEKEQDDISVYVSSKHLPEDVTVKHGYLDHMKREGY